MTMFNIKIIETANSRTVSRGIDWLKHTCDNVRNMFTTSERDKAGSFSRADAEELIAKLQPIWPHTIFEIHAEIPFNSRFD